METGIHELTAGYALDALDADERRAYEDHLEGCERCQEELSSLWETTEALALAASGPVPSEGLRDRILAGARAERQKVIPFERRRRLTVPVLAAATAVAAVVAIGVGIWAAGVSGDLDDAQLALERERAALDVLAASDARRVALQIGEGQLVVRPDGEAVLVLDGLDDAPEDKTYVAWIVEDGAPVPAGTFPGNEERDLVLLEGSVDEGDAVAVTLEDGPVEAPTTAPIVGSRRV